MKSTVSLTADDIVRLLGPKVDAPSARKAVVLAAQRVGVPLPTDPSSALKVLEELTKDTTLLGVLARFAKARVILM